MSIVNELDKMVTKIDDQNELKEVLRQVVKEMWNLEYKCLGYSKHITNLHNTVTKDDVSVLSRTIFDNAKQIEVDFYNAKIKEEEMKMTKLEMQVHDFSLDNKDRKSQERMRFELSAVFRAMTDEIRAIRANTDYELKKLHARCQGTNERLEKVINKMEGGKATKNVIHKAVPLSISEDICKRFAASGRIDEGFLARFIGVGNTTVLSEELLEDMVDIASSSETIMEMKKRLIGDLLNEPKERGDVGQLHKEAKQRRAENDNLR